MTSLTLFVESRGASLFERLVGTLLTLFAESRGTAFFEGLTGTSLFEDVAHCSGSTLGSLSLAH